MAASPTQILVTHNLADVRAVADTTHKEIVGAILGASTSHAYPRTRRPAVGRVAP